MSNDIILIVIPPHASHLLQLLDVAVFGPLKRHFANAANRLTRTGMWNIEKTEWVELYRFVRPKGMCPKNVLSA